MGSTRRARHPLAVLAVAAFLIALAAFAFGWTWDAPR